MDKTLRKTISLTLVMLVIGLAACVNDQLKSSYRRAWKDKAIAGVSSKLSDPAWLEGELGTLNKRTASDSEEYESWLSDHLILMHSGDWLAYASICRKQDSRIRDLFVARGSNGQWYYSTYHFCKGMSSLKGDDQPQNLAEFVKEYYLRPFDGHSDECLQKTWPAN